MLSVPVADKVDCLCIGFIRDYAGILPTASHAYNFQANAYHFTDNTVMANNAASQADVAVDPTLQVSLLHAQRHICTGCTDCHHKTGHMHHINKSYLESWKCVFN